MAPAWSQPTPPPILAPVQPGGGPSEVYTPPATEAPRFVVLRERQRVIYRPGQMVRAETGEAWIFEFAQTPNDPLPLAPMQLLPCALLGGMELLAEQHAPVPLTFRVSGEVTEYHGRSYLLVTKALAELPAATTEPAGQAATAPAQP